jgi:hypothetical protein
MAKISALPVIDTTDGEELLPIVKGGIARRLTLRALASAVVPFLQGWYKGDKGDPGAETGSVGPFSALSNMTIRVGTNRFMVDDGGFLFADPSLTAADVTAYPKAVVKTENNRFFRRASRRISLAEFGATGTGEDIYPLLVAARAWLTRFRSYVAGDYSSIGTIEIPDGDYTMSQTFLHDDGEIAIIGNDPGLDGPHRCVIRPVAGISAFKFLSRNDVRNPNTPKNGTKPDGSSLIGVALISAGFGDGSSYGVQVGQRGIFDRLFCYGFGYGFAIEADTGSGKGNANDCVVGTITVSGNLHDGYLCAGGDANTGTIKKISAHNNGGWGAHLSEFLGSDYGCIHGASNGLGTLLADNPNNRGTIAFLYDEGGQPPSNISNSRMVVSNVQTANGFIGPSIYNDAGGGIGVSGSFVASTKSGSRIISTKLASDPNAGFVRLMSDSADTSPVSFQFHETLGGGALTLGYNQVGITYVTGANPVGGFAQFGTGVAQPRVFTIATLAQYNHAGNDARRSWIDAGPPTTGLHAAGEYIRNTNGASGQPSGWTCKALGTPGIWAPGPAIP